LNDAALGQFIGAVFMTHTAFIAGSVIAFFIIILLIMFIREITL